MKKNTKLKLSLVIFLLLSALFIELLIKANHKPKLRQCPDEWIQNRMPGYDSTQKTNDYFIVNGNREEIHMFDMDWVKKHCTLVPTKVY